MKINFNRNINKQAQDVIISRKIKVTAHFQLVFNNDKVHQSMFLKCFSISSKIFYNILKVCLINAW